MSEILQKGFRLAEVEVRPAENQIVLGGEPIRIEPKAMDVLLALAAAGREIVSREQLTSQVWPRGFVTDDALNRCISNLRSTLGDDPRVPRFIITVPRKGYRLALLAEPLAGAAGMLVLPFQNLSPVDDYIADGLTELLIARLSVALDQPVISRTTAMSFKNSKRDLTSIRGQLGVRWVVEGSLMQLDQQSQIVVQLIDAETDSHVWAETWTRPTGDMLTVLNEVSRLVANRIRTELQPETEVRPVEHRLPTDLLRAYLHGLQLNSQRTRESLREAVTCFERVLKAVPDHAGALSGMAASHVFLAHYGVLPVAEGFGRAREYAQGSLAQNPGQVDAMIHLAAVSFFYDWDFDKAGKLVEGALSLNPHEGLGLILAADRCVLKGRNEAAQNLVDRALAVDPLNVGLLMNSGDLLILMRRYGEAAVSLEEALRIRPGLRPVRLRLALAHAFSGNGDRALSCLEDARGMGGEDASYIEYLAIVRGRLSQAKSALQAAESLQRLADGGQAVAHWALARAWASAGHADRALEQLEAAYDTRSSSMPFLGVTPVFDAIRELPKVQALMGRVGLP